jgi:hypothetical protein
MKLALKSALLSGIVLPGLGQIYLKYYLRGLVFLIPTLTCLYILIAKVVEALELIFQKILNNSNGIVDVNAIQSQVNEMFKGQNIIFYQILEYVLLICWVTSTIDAFSLGRKKDKEKKSSEIL